jgi:hypothetical protein
MKKFSGLSFYSKNSFIGDPKILIRIKDMKLLELMGVLSSMHNNGWNKISDKKYQLDASLKDIEDMYSPKNEQTRYMYKLGKDCLDFVRDSGNEKLKSDFKQGLSPEQFPAEIQEKIHDFAQRKTGIPKEKAKELQIKIRIVDETTPFGEDKYLGAARARIEIRYIDVNIEHGSVIFAVDFSDQAN